MELSRYILLFIIYSLCGWIFESIYAVITRGVWENRGFLYGPICPIYGSGAVIITFVVDMLNIAGARIPAWWGIFLIAFFGSIVLEYGTSWTLEKLFHAYWWDYSNMPLNVNGRICLPASLLFGCAGVGIVFGTMPFFDRILDGIPAPAEEIFAFFMVALLSSDATLTISALTDFANTIAAADEAMTRHMEQFVESLEEKKPSVGQIVENLGENIGDARQKVAELIETAEGKLPLPDKLPFAGEDRGESRESRLSKERERFALKNLDFAASHMSWLKRRALTRVQGFRLPADSRFSGMRDYIDTAQSYIRKYRHKRKEKKSGR